MKQASLGLFLSTTKTPKPVLLDEMERMVPWSALVAILESHRPRSKTGCTTCRCTASSPDWTRAPTGYPMRAPSCDFATCWRAAT